MAQRYQEAQSSERQTAPSGLFTHSGVSPGERGRGRTGGESFFFFLAQVIFTSVCQEPLLGFLWEEKENHRHVFCLACFS